MTATYVAPTDRTREIKAHPAEALTEMLNRTVAKHFDDTTVITPEIIEDLIENHWQAVQLAAHALHDQIIDRKRAAAREEAFQKRREAKEKKLPPPLEGLEHL